MSWTGAADAVLREAYARGGIYAAQTAFPQLSQQQLYKRASRLGVQRRRRWTVRDDARLRDLWGSEPLANIARSLGRTVVTTYWRAKQLTLPLGCPQGSEYLTHAAKRTGFTTGQLRRILAFCGVRLACSYARPRPSSRTGRLFHVVDTFDVDQAVEAWMATETLQSAARRHHVAACTVRRRLEASGCPVRRATPGAVRQGRRVHYRVVSTDVDRVMAGSVRVRGDAQVLDVPQLVQRTLGIEPKGAWRELAEGHRAGGGETGSLRRGTAGAVARRNLRSASGDGEHARNVIPKVTRDNRVSHGG